MLSAFTRTAGLAAASAFILLAAAGAAQADDKPAVVFNAGVQSDYVFRGVSQTDGRASVFAGADATWGQLYAGTWTSNLDFKPFGDSHTNEEVDLYAGLRPTVANVSLDLGAQYYGYVNQPSGGRVAYTEVYAKATRAFGPATVGASLYYSPQFTGHTGEAWYSEANLAYTLSKKWSASGALGRQDIAAGGSYTTWNAGLTYAVTSHLSLDGRYWDTNEHRFGDPYHARAVLALKATF
ncbi:MAG TPA: TorF family putative porin [Caulobacteraceae bacterium]